MPFDPSNLELDMSQEFTLGEIAAFEEASGLDIHVLNRTDENGDPVPPSGKAMLGLAFIAAKRQDPRVTLRQVREIKPSSLRMVSADPLPPPPPPSGTSD